jgi:galactokinase
MVTLTNLDPTHESPLAFRLSDEMSLAPEACRRGWVHYIQDPEVGRRREVLADPKERGRGRTGSINFIKAAALRLATGASAPLRGADMVIEGNIPIGVGQSSSSALVVVAALVFDRLWNLDLDPRRMASVCGEAEWYVGTRGGAGDHAAMLLGSPTGLVGVRFVPPVEVRDARPMPFPPGYQLLIANSSHRAIKNKEERRQFNAGILAYRFALLYLKEAVSALREELGLPIEGGDIRFLSDLSTERFPLHVMYRLLLALPETVSPRELAARHPEVYESGAMTCFGTTDCGQLPAHIPIRGAALYGLGRVDRGLAMHELCVRGDEAAMTEFGRLMYVTHDGDRVSRYDVRSGRHIEYSANRKGLSDSRLGELLAISLNGSSNAERGSAELRWQSGYYGASIPELDRIVDIVAPLPDVLGAGLMGAGGGGCVLILARDGEDALASVTRALAEHYYEPLGKPADVEPWVPSAPAAELDFLVGS